jgi:hypothetical protein
MGARHGRVGCTFHARALQPAAGTLADQHMRRLPERARGQIGIGEMGHHPPETPRSCRWAGNWDFVRWKWSPGWHGQPAMPGRPSRRVENRAAIAVTGAE